MRRRPRRGRGRNGSRRRGGRRGGGGARSDDAGDDRGGDRGCDCNDDGELRLGSAISAFIGEDDGGGGGEGDREHEGEEEGERERSSPPPSRCPRAGGGIGRVVSPVSHLRQSETWDCGVACVQMVMRWIRDGTGTPDEETAARDDTYGGSSPPTADEVAERERMLSALGTSSVWTVDLVFLLDPSLGQSCLPPSPSPADGNDGEGEFDDASSKSSLATNLLFASTNLGVDPSHSDIGYYSSAFAADERRVSRRFRQLLLESPTSPTMTTVIKLACFRLDALLDLVSRPDVVAIALLDNRVLLSEERAEEEEGVGETGGGDGREEGKRQRRCRSPYAGHYVLVIGVVGVASCRPGDDPGDVALAIKNPGSDRPVDLIRTSKFERAWRSNGTDDDVIFVRRLR